MKEVFKAPAAMVSLAAAAFVGLDEAKAQTPITQQQQSTPALNVSYLSSQFKVCADLGLNPTLVTATVQPFNSPAYNSLFSLPSSQIAPYVDYLGGAQYCTVENVLLGEKIPAGTTIAVAGGTPIFPGGQVARFGFQDLATLTNNSGGPVRVAMILVDNPSAEPGLTTVLPTGFDTSRQYVVNNWPGGAAAAPKTKYIVNPQVWSMDVNDVPNGQQADPQQPVVTIQGLEAEVPNIYPKIQLQQNGTDIRASWGAEAIGYSLQISSDLTTGTWQTVTAVSPITTARHFDTPNTVQRRFFRLVPGQD